MHPLADQSLGIRVQGDRGAHGGIIASELLMLDAIRRLVVRASIRKHPSHIRGRRDARSGKGGRVLRGMAPAIGTQSPALPVRGDRPDGDRFAHHG
ncbi:MAG: hypothetical protein NVSMB32_00430 [Actinomycetota bacterium]